MRSTLSAAALVAAGLTLAACGDARKDATTSGQRVDRGPAEVIAMPDAFRNVAHKCIKGKGLRVFSNSTGGEGSSSQLFVIRDPTC